jgi:hypothetical protein
LGIAVGLYNDFFQDRLAAAQLPQTCPGARDKVKQRLGGIVGKSKLSSVESAPKMTQTTPLHPATTMHHTSVIVEVRTSIAQLTHVLEEVAAGQVLPRRPGWI